MYGICLFFCLSLNAPAISEQALSDLAVLSDQAMNGRKTGTPGAKRAAEYIRTRYKEIGLAPVSDNYSQHFTYSSGFWSQAQGENLVAQIVSDPQKPFIAITAHYDHLGNKGRLVYNGADDNASGVSALLALATKLKNTQTNYNYVFIATDAEEQGLHGARAYFDNPKNPKKNIILNINLDMLGIGGKKMRLLALYSSELKPYKTMIEQRHDTSKAHIKMSRGRGFYPDSTHRARRQILNASDHSIFRKAGIPFVYFGVGVHKHYHKTTDNFENINKPFYRASIENLLRVVTLLDQHFVAQNGS